MTKLYIRVIRDIAWKATSETLSRSVTACIREALSGNSGAGQFLKRQVLGRRLTRSARAVIIPRPDLKMDQIAIPRWIANTLFDGLSQDQRGLVLVNRNPTLHKRSLIALRPVIEDRDWSVFGLPLAVLGPMNADFDGDQVAIVALETLKALQEAHRLLPGAAGMRTDPFREKTPAFPLLHELRDVSEEISLAENTGLSQEEWVDAHHRYLQQRLRSLDDGFSSMAPLIGEHDWLKRADEEAWLERAREEMKGIYSSARKKGRAGGILRREIYRRRFESLDAFWRTIEALQVVTQPIAQRTLSVKSGNAIESKGSTITFSEKTYFKDPSAGTEMLKGDVESSLSAASIAKTVGSPETPRGLLGWLARPTGDALLRISKGHESAVCAADPRVNWFIL